MKFIQTRLGFVKDAHTHINRFAEFHLEFTRVSITYEFLLLLDFPKRYFDCENLVSQLLPRAVSSVPMRQESHIDVIAHIIHGFNKYRIVHWFIQIFLKIIVRASSEIYI